MLNINQDGEIQYNPQYSDQVHYFDCAAGLYWFCAHYHGGQWSKLYSIMCQLDYRPGACETGTFDNDEWEQAKMVYDYLEEIEKSTLYPEGKPVGLHQIDIIAQELLEAIQTAFNQAHERE